MIHLQVEEVYPLQALHSLMPSSLSACQAQLVGEGKLLDQGIYNYSFTGVGTVTNLLAPDGALKVTSLLIDGGRK